jgi:hypothetical protein
MKLKRNRVFSKRWTCITTFVICLSFSSICCKPFSTVNETDLVQKDFTPLHIETLAESIPPNSSFESNTFAWYQEDATESITLPTSKRLSMYNAPKSWRVCTYASNLFLHMDDRYFYINSEDQDYLYQKFDLTTGKHIEPFLKRNVDDLSFSLEKIRTPTPASFTPPLKGYAYNEDHEYKKEQWKIVAIEKTEDQQTTLWEHEIPHKNELPNDDASWGGFIQYDDILVYTTYIVNQRYGRNFITRAISKDTGEVLWEVKNPIESGSLSFPNVINTSILNRIGRYYYIVGVSNTTTFNYVSDKTLYVINTKTGKMEGNVKSCGDLIDSDGLLLRTWYEGSGKGNYIAQTNLITLEDTIVGSSKDIAGLYPIDATKETILIDYHSKTILSAYDRGTLTEIWQIENATGYSKIQPDGTMVVIIGNQYICQVNVQDGSVCQYWNLGSLLTHKYTCMNYDTDEGNILKVSPDGLLVLLVDEQIPISPDKIQHQQKILALPLVEE